MYRMFLCLFYLQHVATMFMPGTCERRCFQHYNPELNCQCNTKCPQYGNCCFDYSSLCKVASSGFSGDTCTGRCQSRYNSSQSCQCNSACLYHHDCCSDYSSLCGRETGGNSSSSSHVSSSSHISIDLSTLADTLWAMDPDKVNISDITIDIGGHLSTGSRTDVSKNPLFTSVHTTVFTTPLYQALFALYDNYNPNRGMPDPLTASDMAEINHFLDVALESPVMESTYNFLIKSELLTGDQIAFRSKIFDLWFQPYARSRGGAKDSSAFEHVFIGEYKGSIVEGFHNWVRFCREEKAGHLNYLGYMRQNGPQMLEFTFDWNNHYKEIDSFIIGSSPVFDIALGTVCFLVKPNSECPYVLDGHPFKIQQYDDTPGLEIATSYTVF